jgi:hypothetical protein
MSVEDTRGVVVGPIRHTQKIRFANRKYYIGLSSMGFDLAASWRPLNTVAKFRRVTELV